MVVKDVIIIGAGAAGLMCAIEAGKHGRKALLIDHAERLGKKILTSGGGRCNFTNINTHHENYLSANPDFCKSALSRYSPNDFISLVEKYQISYHEKKLGQLFCDQSSRQIVDLLKEECKISRVEIKLECNVKSIRKNTLFQVETNQGLFSSSSLVIATGGLSFPKLGATDFGYRIAKEFNLKVTEVRPALVPFIVRDGFNSNSRENQNHHREFNRFGELSGISIDTIVHHHNQNFRENILFTHRGLSGPAILQISSYWQKGQTIEINLLPEKSILNILSNENQNKTLSNLLSQYLPKRFVQHWCDESLSSKTIKNLIKTEQEKIAQQLHHWKVTPEDTESYSKAEVTLGGVSTQELSSKTMETRKVSGLYFIGEVVDVTGWLGGFNFQWAWASGHAAGQYV